MNKQEVYLAALLMDVPDAGIQQFLEMKIGSDVLQNASLRNLLHYSRRLVLGDDHNKVATGVPLASIYEEIFNDHYQASWYFEASPLSLKEADFFPKKGITYNVDNVATCWNALLKSLKALKKSDLGILADCTLALLKKYTVKIHCGFENNPSISYYDYAKSLAGIAVCLFEWQKEKKNQLEDEKIVPFLLVGGDLSGIQDFIYDIISKNAAKNLKGRSFYLQLLISSILRSLLDRLGLFKCNVIYDSGGGFNLLAPNNDATINVLKKLEKEFSDKLFKEHRTTLYLGLAWKSTSYSQIIKEGLGDIQSHIHTLLGTKKRKRHIGKVVSYNALFHEPVEKGGAGVRDAITGAEIALSNLATARYIHPDRGLENRSADKAIVQKGENIVSLSTAKQILLGKYLKDTDYWVSMEGQVSENLFASKGVSVDPCQINVSNFLVAQEDFEKISSFPTNQSIHINILNRFEINEQIASAEKISFDFTLYGGNKYATDNLNNPATFSEMAGAPDDDKQKRYADYQFQELDFKRLGILRMDVDDLGYIFQKGFRYDGKQTKISFAKYTTLSRSMDFFFKGYINTIWKSNEIDQSSQIIYAGGDDLFVIGRWDKMVEFSEKLREAFAKWTCKNNQLGISGGMSIVTHKYPIMKAAEMAGDAEKDAKNHSRDPLIICEPSLEKKSFTLLGMPLHYGYHSNWLNEFELVKQLKDELIQLIGTGKRDLSKGALLRIMVLEEMRKRAEQNKENPQWQWLTAYYFSKTANDIKRRGGIEVHDYLKQRSEDIMFNKYKGQKIESPYPFLQLYALAARWAELERRQIEAIHKSKQQ